jgi:hypothetical protein
MVTLGEIVIFHVDDVTTERHVGPIGSDEVSVVGAECGAPAVREGIPGACVHAGAHATGRYLWPHRRESTVLVGRLRGHTEDRKFGVAAIAGGARAADDLDLLDESGRIMTAHLHRAVESFVDGNAVDEQQDLAFVRPEAAEVGADHGIDVVAERKPGHEREDVHEIACTGVGDLLLGDDGDDAGCSRTGFSVTDAMVTRS